MTTDLSVALWLVTTARSSSSHAAVRNTPDGDSPSRAGTCTAARSSTLPAARPWALGCRAAVPRRPDGSSWDPAGWAVPSGDTRRVTTLRPSSLAAASARRFVERACAAWPLAPRAVDDASVVAGEVVAMSVRQARTPLALLVQATGQGVLVVVHDHSALLPMPLEPPASPSADRSVSIVHQLTCCWGFDRVDACRLVWGLVPRS